MKSCSDLDGREFLLLLRFLCLYAPRRLFRSPGLFHVLTSWPMSLNTWATEALYIRDINAPNVRRAAGGNMAQQIGYRSRGPHALVQIRCTESNSARVLAYSARSEYEAELCGRPWSCLRGSGQHDIYLSESVRASRKPRLLSQ
jgi:hypothetical protein